VPTSDIAPARRYRGAIIGSGNIALHAHLPAFRETPGVRERVDIVALVDGASAAKVAGVPHLSDRRQLTDLGPIDFIDICTPTATHLELATWGLEQGYHVLCEKPVAISPGDAAGLRLLAAERGRIVVPCHQYRFNPAWRTLAQWLEAGRIGRWHLAEFAVYRQLADPGALRASTPWRGSRQDSLGGVLLDHGTHLIYQLLDVAGLPHAVNAWTGRLRHGDYDVEDTASLLFEYHDRAATMLLTWAAARRDNLIRFTGEFGTIELVGGELRLDAGPATERVDFSEQLQKAAYPVWFGRLFAEFVDALDMGGADAALHDIARVATVLDLAYTAAATGCRQTPVLLV